MSGAISVLVNVDRLPVGALWQTPDRGLHRKLSPYSHRNERTGEIVLDERLYGVQQREPFFVEEVLA
jgi:hypothetical protein